MPDGDWERKTVSEKHSDVAQRPGKNKLRLVILTFNGTFMWVKQACQVLPSELCIPNPSSVGKLHPSLVQCGSHEHPDHNQPSPVCPTANCSAFVTASQTHASDQLGLLATTQTIAFPNLKRKGGPSVRLVHGQQQHVLCAMLCCCDRKAQVTELLQWVNE